MKGSIKFWNEKRGFGFIIGEDTKEYFCHFTKILNLEGRKTLLPNQQVSFYPKQNDRGLSAENVMIEW